MVKSRRGFSRATDFSGAIMRRDFFATKESCVVFTLCRAHLVGLG